MAGSRGKRLFSHCRMSAWDENVGRNAMRGGTEDTIKEGGQVASQPRRVVLFLQAEADQTHPYVMLFLPRVSICILSGRGQDWIGLNWAAS